MNADDERRAVAALLTEAQRGSTLVETAALLGDGGDARRGEGADAEGLRLAADHGVGPERLSAYAGLARTRGVTLERVLRATLRGELRAIVALPPADVKSGEAGR